MEYVVFFTILLSAVAGYAISPSDIARPMYMIVGSLIGIVLSIPAVFGALYLVNRFL